MQSKNGVKHRMTKSTKHNRIRITTLEQLEKQSLLHTLNMTPEQRMEYLLQLRSIIHGNDLSKAEELFYKSRIKTNRLDENS